MSWEDVKGKFKFYGPVADGLDDDPTFVNGWKAADYGVGCQCLSTDMPLRC
jgi:hypothetical protein